MEVEGGIAGAGRQLFQGRRLLGLLPNDELRRIALDRMAGYRDEEIAAHLGCSRRTVMRKLIRRIVTDSTPPEQPKDPDTDTLVALLRAFAEPATVAAVEERYRTGGIGYGEVKARVADAIDAHVAPMRSRYQRLLNDPAELDARLAKGEQHAGRRAGRTLARAVAAMGL